MSSNSKRNTQPRKQPSQQRSRDNVERILQAAADVLEEQGYDQLKTVTIAQRAGASVGSVYQYFPNKHAILTQLVERWLQIDSDALQLVESRREQYKTIVDEFLDLTEILVASYKRQRGLFAIYTLCNNIPELHEMAEAHDKIYARRVAQLIERHGIVPDEAERLALAAYFTIVVDATAMSIAVETKQRADLKLKFLRHSVRDMFLRYL